MTISRYRCRHEHEDHLSKRGARREARHRRTRRLDAARASTSSPGSSFARPAGGSQLAATDMELSLRVALDAPVEDEGAVVVPGRLLVDIARLLPPGEVTLEHRAEEGRRAAHLRLGVVPACTRSAPRTSRACRSSTADEPFSVDRQAFLDTIAKVGRSASRDESRPVLTGILVRFEGGKLVMAATDSYRLSVKETALADRARPASSRRSCRRARSASSRGSPGAPSRRRSRSASTRTRSSSPWTASR